MPYANNNGVRIHYQVDGQGYPLMLMHGAYGSLEDWYEYGWVKGLKEGFQLIMMDHRGLGHSDKPYDPNAYSLEITASDIVTVLDDLGIRKAHYFGYSMGGWIAFGVAKYAPERFESLVIGASHPYERKMEAQRQFFDQSMEDFIESSLASEPKYSDWLRVRTAANDLKALKAMAQDRPDLSDVIPTMTMPCLLYAGDADPLYAQPKSARKACPTHVSCLYLG